MYFLVSKISFAEDDATAHDARELKALVERIRSRFKVCALAQPTDSRHGSLGIVLTFLGHHQEQVNQTMDAVIDYCENSGFGRIDQELTLMDHVDNLAEDYVEDDL